MIFNQSLSFLCEHPKRSLAQQRERHAERIADILCQDLIASSTEERIRDIASLALKACVAEIGEKETFFLFFLLRVIKISACIMFYIKNIKIYFSFNFRSYFLTGALFLSNSMS